MIYFTNEITGDHGNCRGSTYKKALAINFSTPGGKEALSAALAAHASQASVTAYGKGRCDVYGDGVAETLDHIIIQ